MSWPRGEGCAWQTSANSMIQLNKKPKPIEVRAAMAYEMPKLIKCKLFIAGYRGARLDSCQGHRLVAVVVVA